MKAGRKLAVFVVLLILTTALWNVASGGGPVTLGGTLAGLVTAAIVTMVADKFVKARQLLRAVGAGTAVARVPPSPAASPAPAVNAEELRGDDLWSRATDAAAAGALDESKSLFAAAIRKDPRKYCGVGPGSWKPARPEAQRVWLEAMSLAGFGDLARVLRNPPNPVDFTISEMMAADRKAAEILEATCHRLGVGKAPADAAVTVRPAPDGPAAWVEERLADRDAWQFALQQKHRDYLAGLDGDDLRLVLDRIDGTLAGTNDYWVLCNCEKLLEPLGERAASVLPRLVQPRHVRHVNAPWRRVALSAIAHLGPAAVSALPVIVAAQSDPDYHVREAAADALKRVRAEAPPP